MWYSLAEISARICHHFAELEDLTPIVLPCHRILFEQAGHPIVGNQIVPNKFLSEVWKCNGVFDEDGVILSSTHQGSLAAQRQFVDFYWTP